MTNLESHFCPFISCFRNISKPIFFFNLLFINQVREQAKASAASIRNDVRKEKERLLNKFANEVEVNQSCFFFLLICILSFARCKSKHHFNTNSEMDSSVKKFGFLNRKG